MKVLYRPNPARATISLLVACSMPLVAFAGDKAPDRATLAHLVRQQAAQLSKQSQQIKNLKKRLDKVEADEQGTATAKNASTATAKSPDQVDQTAANAKAIDHIKREQALLKASASSHSAVDLSDGGPKFVSADGSRSFQIGGRLMFDFSSTQGSSYKGDRNDRGRDITGIEARRLRLDFRGKLANHVHYRLQYDLANNDASIRDAYIEPDFQLFGHEVKLYLGNKYDDIGLSGATSSNKTWFMQRNYVFNAVEPERGHYGLGGKAKLYGHNWHLSFGVTSGTLGDSFDDEGKGNVTYASRAHWNPWRKGPNMVHLGVWGFYEDFDTSEGAVFKPTRAVGHYNENVEIRSRLLRDPSSSTAYGFELATSLGSFAAAAEYGYRHVDQRNSEGHENMEYHAYSVSTGYFLTGEHHGYSHKNGVWKFPHVKNPVTGGGYGAFELAARFEKLDFNDQPNYPGGQGHNTTIGLNWYPADWGRIMLNDVLWYTHNRSGDFKRSEHGNTIKARLQIMF